MYSYWFDMSLMSAVVYFGGTVTGAKRNSKGYIVRGMKPSIQITTRKSFKVCFN